MFRALFLVVLLTGCVTGDPVIRDDLSAGEVERWNQKIEADKRRLSAELRKYRDPLLSKKATRTHLWRVEKPGETHYLIGTIHAGVAWTSFPLRIKDCLTRAKTAVFEVDLDRGPSDAILAAYQKLAEKELAGPRASAAGPSAWSRYKDEMLPIRRSVLEALSPTLALNYFLYIRDEFVRGDDSHMDSEIFLDARKLGKKIASLDTEAELAPTFEMMEGLLEPLSVEDFRKIFEGDPFEAYKRHLTGAYELAVTYKTGDHTAVEALVKKLMSAQRYDVLIRRRNLAWLPRLEKHLAGGPALVAVGVGHMTGDASLITLLAAKGYQVTPTDRCDP